MNSGKRWFLAAASLSPGDGGIARVARLSARTLMEGGSPPTMLCLGEAGAASVGGLKPVSAKGSRVRFAARCYRGALSHDWFIYDAVGTARAHPGIPGLRRPYCVWIHGVEVWDYLSPARERALRAAEFVLVNSQFTLARFQELHGPIDNAAVCRLATEEDDAPAGAPAFDGPPTALLIGRADRDNMRKGHIEVIDSWASVVKAIPDARLIMAGGGDGLDVVKDLVRASPAGDNIEVLGFVPEADMPALWRRSQVFVQPSWKEGFGLVYIEAMRYGLPVIASLHDAGQEVNVDGVTGYNVDLGRSGDLADRLVGLFNDRDAAQAMGKAGRERWRAEFRYSAFRDRLTDHLRRQKAI